MLKVQTTPAGSMALQHASVKVIKTKRQVHGMD
jgi:hypothetical protein